MMFSFKAIIASRGYHFYKETSCSNEKFNDEAKVDLEKRMANHFQPTQMRVL